MFLRGLLRLKDSNINIEKYLPDIASGRILGAFAMSEASSGSNPQEILATARKGDGGFYLSGHKRWIGNAAWSGLIIVFAKVEKNSSSPVTPSGMTAFIVKTQSDGLSMGAEALTLGMNALIQNDLILDNVFVPDQMVLGRVGRGFEIAADAMMLTRLGVAAVAIGAMRRGLQIAQQFTMNRKISSFVLADFQTMRLSLREIAADIIILEHAVMAVAKRMDKASTVPNEIYTALKYISAEWSWLGVDAVMQSLGARGYLESNPVAQLMADVRLFRIFEGTSETMADFLGKRVLSSTLTPGVIPETTDETINSTVSFLLLEFNKILFAVKEKTEKSLISPGSISAQLMGKLLSVLIIAILFLENFQENDTAMKNILLDRIKDHFFKEKALFISHFPEHIGADANNLVEKALKNFPLIEQMAPHFSRDFDFMNKL